MNILNPLCTFKTLCLFIIPLCLSAQEYYGDSSEIEKILETSRAFSMAYMDEDIELLTHFYTENAHIMPPKAPVISGHEDIKKRWTLAECVDVLLHEVEPYEIRILDDFAYDYGTYKGSTKNCKKKEFTWSGKYVIMWKKIGEEWKIYLDIWNSVDTEE